jgi:hypothetical protein
VFATGQAEPSELKAFQSDVRVGQQIGLVTRGRQQLRR